MTETLDILVVVRDNATFCFPKFRVGEFRAVIKHVILITEATLAPRFSCLRTSCANFGCTGRCYRSLNDNLQLEQLMEVTEPRRRTYRHVFSILTYQ